MSNPRKIAIIVGSTSDFVQCETAVPILKAAENIGKIEVVTPASIDTKIIVASIHRHKQYLLHGVLPDLIELGVTAIICGAGWAAHLPGMVDSHLRYDLKNDTISIIGVAFDNVHNPMHTIAAMLSISDVPGTQVIFDGRHIGSNGMCHACNIAISGHLPPITLPDHTKKPSGIFTWEAMSKIITAKK